MVPLGKNDPKRHSLVLFSEDPAYTAMRDALTRAANATPKAPAEPVDPTAGDAELARCLALGLQPRRARRGRGPGDARSGDEGGPFRRHAGVAGADEPRQAHHH